MAAVGPENYLDDVSGEVDIQVEYKPGQPTGTLSITVVEARNLRSVSSKGAANPYVKTYLLPDRKQQTKRKTRVVRHSLNPVFGDVLKYENVKEEDLEKRSLQVAVWHCDRLGRNMHLGERVIPLVHYPWDLNQEPSTFTLLTAKASKVAVWHCDRLGGNMHLSERVIPLVHYPWDLNQEPSTFTLLTAKASKVAVWHCDRLGGNMHLSERVIPLVHYPWDLNQEPSTFTLLTAKASKVAVWHCDRLGGNMHLSERVIPLVHYPWDLNQEPSTFTLLTAKASKPNKNLQQPRCPTYLCVQRHCLTVPKLHLSLKFVVSQKSGKGVLKCVIHRATGLVPIKPEGRVDAFVKGAVMPEKNRRLSQKTAIVTCNLGPDNSAVIWDEELSFSGLDSKKVSKKWLELTIWQFERFAPNTFLGSLHLGLSSSIPKSASIQSDAWSDGGQQESEIWQAMMDRPNDIVPAALTLRNAIHESRIEI